MESVQKEATKSMTEAIREMSRCRAARVAGFNEAETAPSLVWRPCTPSSLQPQLSLSH
jgi:hypothetical protein